LSSNIRRNPRLLFYNEFIDKAVKIHIMKINGIVRNSKKSLTIKEEKNGTETNRQRND
jgi:hypothetical protein